MEQCHRPTPNIICDFCNRKLYRELRAVEWLSPQLQITLTRRDQLGDPLHDGGHAAEKPLVFNAAASETAFVLRDTLRTWVGELCDHIGIEFVPVWATHPVDFVGPIRPRERRMRRNFRPTSTDYAAWLAHHVVRIPQLPDAAVCADEITDAISLVRAAIDKREVPVFAGPCPECPEGGLFGRRDADRLHCRSCGAKVARADNDVSVHGELAKRFFPAVELVIIVRTVLDIEVTQKRIHDLGYRRRNPVRTVTDTSGRKLYSAADVLGALGHGPVYSLAA